MRKILLLALLAVNAQAEEKPEVSEESQEETIELSEELDDEDPDRIIPSSDDDSSHDNEVEQLEANAAVSEDDKRWYDEELKGLHESRKRRLQKRISSLERDQSEYEQSLFKENMSDPNVHFRVALTHQSRGDAEGAIIHMQKAEALYKNQKNLRGMARSRKALRKYYKAYGYLPEDFDITR